MRLKKVMFYKKGFDRTKKGRRVISRKFPISFRGASDLVILKSGKSEKSQKKIIKRHQVTSTPETNRKLAWNQLTVFSLNFGQIFLVLYSPSPIYKAIGLLLQYS